MIKRLAMISAVFTMLSIGTATAMPINNGCQGNCPTNNTTNNTTNNNTVNKGGKGGTGVGIGIGKGGNAAASSKSSATVKNNNTNVGVNTNDVTNKNYNSDYNANVNKNDLNQKQKQDQANKQKTDVTVEGDEAADIPTSSASTTVLTTSNDTCMGSSGLGVQGMQFGFSVGSTWTDSNCVMIKNARELKSHGFKDAAKARLCMDQDNALAFELAGKPCPQALKTAQVARELAQAPVSRTSVTGTQVASAAPVAGSFDKISTSEENSTDVE